VPQMKINLMKINLGEAKLLVFSARYVFGLHTIIGVKTPPDLETP
jgi:hypothetical protein